MKLKHYIQGDKRGKEAHRLERQAMSDPFLHDALEGFDTVPGNHADALERLEKKLLHRSTASKRKQQIVWWSMAATVLLLIGLGGYFFLQNEVKNAPVIATTQNTAPQTDKPEAKVAEVAKLAEEQQKSTPKFVPPVIKPDEQVIEEEPAIQQVMESSAAVGAVNFDKGTDDVAVPVATFSAPEQNKIVIKGKVVDESGQPLIGVSVVEKGASKGTITNPDGKFALQVNKTDSLELRANYIGYEAKALKITSDTEPVIALRESHNELNEVAVVGYGTRQKLLTKAAKLQRFGEKEFKEFVQNTAQKNICGNEQAAFVKLKFSINHDGRPTDFSFTNYSCEEAKLEMEKLLKGSPVWTTPNQKVNMEVSW